MLNEGFGYLNTLKISIIILLVLLAANGTRAETCTLKNNQRAWIEHSFTLWQMVSSNSLRLKPAPLPWVVLFDETCVWHLNPDLSISALKLPSDAVTMKISVTRKSSDVYGFVHRGEITLPDNTKIPPQLIAYTSTYQNGQKPFMIFPMPSIWRQAEHLKSEINLDLLIRGVFAHEMTHTRHRQFYDRLDGIEKQYKFSEKFSDDIIQDHFGKREDFRKAYETERDLLYQAVSETDRATQTWFG